VQLCLDTAAQRSTQQQLHASRHCSIGSS
jgi:hypothetical protein